MKRRAFPGYGPEIEARYQRSAQWLLAAIYGNDKALTWCQANGVALVKAAGETINTAGGFVVPTELANAIIDLRETYGAFRRTALVLPMGSDTSDVVRRTGTTAAFFMGENAGATESKVGVDKIALTAKKIGTLVRLSSELEDDSPTGIVDFVANEIAWAFAVMEDDCAFNGDGTAAFGRMRGIGQIVLDGSHAKATVTAASGHNTFATLDNTDITNLMSAVAAAAIPNASWFCSQTCFATTFVRLATGGGAAYLATRVLDGVETPYFMGFPVQLTQKLPLVTTTLSGKTMLAFGDMYAGAVLGQRRGITLARSADRYLDQDQIAVLGTERFHANVHGLGDNSNTGSLAALVGG